MAMLFFQAMVLKPTTKSYDHYYSFPQSSRSQPTHDVTKHLWLAPPSLPNAHSWLFFGNAGPREYPWCVRATSWDFSVTSLPALSQYTGLVYIKIDKAYSSTLSGINMRLARNVGAKVLGEGRVCSHSKDHFRASTRLNPGHDPHKSPFNLLLWTFLRDPASRALSQYLHFQVSRQGWGLSSFEVVRLFLELETKNFETEYTMIPPYGFDGIDTLKEKLHEVSFRYGNETVDQSVATTFLYENVLQRYNFIGLVERMDESLAVMKLLWNLEVGDLIVMSSKQSGGYDDGRFNNTCVKIVKPSDFAEGSKSNHVLMRIKNYLSTDFKHQNLDYALYDMVNVSLDRTIDMLGRNKVHEVVMELRSLQQRVDSACRDKVMYPCSSNGTRQHAISAQDCYWYDSGCGYRCVDEVLTGRTVKFLT